ncbi:hypothetical protein EUX98_g4029 [Antrodiella citrinella]|uniref:DUF6533 domain-containing protein n=1 Tax=Antrodiella citrinella TaxID=2447956 RepID=A0A4S4MXI5_9APHY|nr:hypothetical protein EUX98_g4029 [Antrodiella citrinella]
MSGNETYFFSNSCLLVAAVLITYDTLLTFSREVQCIWTKKPNLVTVLFILQRYCTLIELVVLGLPAVMPINLLGYILFSFLRRSGY